MKRPTLTLIAAFLLSPAAFAADHIPWHWDEVEKQRVVQRADQPAPEDNKWTSDIGW